MATKVIAQCVLSRLAARYGEPSVPTLAEHQAHALALLAVWNGNV